MAWLSSSSKGSYCAQEEELQDYVGGQVASPRGKGKKGGRVIPALSVLPTRVLGKPEGRQVTGFLVTQLSQSQEASNKRLLFPSQTSPPAPCGFWGAGRSLGEA